jgi:hypothetical protein
MWAFFYAARIPSRLAIEMSLDVCGGAMTRSIMMKVSGGGGGTFLFFYL